MSPNKLDFQKKLIFHQVVHFRKGGQVVVADFDYNTSTAQMELDLGLSLAIRVQSIRRQKDSHQVPVIYLNLNQKMWLT